MKTRRVWLWTQRLGREIEKEGDGEDFTEIMKKKYMYKVFSFRAIFNTLYPNSKYLNRSDRTLINK